MARVLKPAEISQVSATGRGSIIGPSSDAIYSGGAIYADHVPDTHAEPIETTTKFTREI